MNNDIQEEEEEEEEEQFLDASEELPQIQELTMEPANDLPSSSSSTKNNDASVSSNKPFGRRSVIVSYPIRIYNYLTEIC